VGLELLVQPDIALSYALTDKMSAIINVSKLTSDDLKLELLILKVQGEYMTSKIILQNGYNVGSMLMAYANRRVEWVSQGNWECGYNLPSSRENWYFGSTLHPLEVASTDDRPNYNR